VNEFALIERFFKRPLPEKYPEILLGIGDDAALIDWTTQEALAVTVDTLVSGIHFLADTPAYGLGHKALAVNLSDLAAMGAAPRWATLALTLPAVDENWLLQFSQGFFDLAERYGVALIGGDTTRGPLSITVQVMGSVPKKSVLKRAGATPGDLIYLSGHLGSAGLGLKMLQGLYTPIDPVLVRHQEQPQPRIELGLFLRDRASACIDVTDGLAADLGHILAASHTGAELVYEQCPLAEAVQAYCRQRGDWHFPLQAGDDYELCFTVPEALDREFRQALTGLDTPTTCIGRIVAADTPCLTIFREGKPLTLTRKGFDHFADA